MTTTTKRQRSRLQRKALRAQHEHGKGLREWMHERAAAVKKALEEKRAAAASGSSGGHGVTRGMRAIKPQPPVYVHRHSAATAFDRRHRRDKTTGKFVTRAAKVRASNTVYVNPEKDRQLAGKKRVQARRAARQATV